MNEPKGYPFPDDEIIWSSALSDFDPQKNSCITVARLPKEHTIKINGKKHVNTHRLAIHSPVRGTETFMINIQADIHALVSAVLVLMAESENGGKGIASAHVPFYERKTGVEIDFSDD